jgi:hypothetical protein
MPVRVPSSEGLGSTQRTKGLVVLSRYLGSVRGTQCGTVPWAAAQEMTLKARGCEWQPVPPDALGCLDRTD